MNMFGKDRPAVWFKTLIIPCQMFQLAFQCLQASLSDSQFLIDVAPRHAGFGRFAFSRSIGLDDWNKGAVVSS